MTIKLNEAQQWLKFIGDKGLLSQWETNMKHAEYGVGETQMNEWISSGLEVLHCTGFNWAKSPEGEKFWYRLSNEFTAAMKKK